MKDREDYKIKLEIFEGPLDLLIHLIRKNEVDIFDIPIALITDQYLGYIDMMKALNINIAGDFLVMAATLIHIKSRLLLPGKDDESETEDPRDEITRPLMEYLQFKELAGDLAERQVLERDVFQRRPDKDYSADFEPEDAQIEVNLFQLMDAFKRILDNFVPDAELTFRRENFTITDRITFILDELKEKESLFFKDLFSSDRTLEEFVITFLAVLEIVHMGLVRIYQPTVESDIRIEARFEEKEEIKEEADNGQITEDDN
ncbi:MAG: segregation/condensation protein A [Deltaproteobacteria bacterium]|nr:segregation/condensation protein A [Deltaproteobacteria bacterium]